MAGRDNVATDFRYARRYGDRTKNCGHRFGRAESVLQRHRQGRRTEQRTRANSGLLYIGGLGQEDHRIDPSNCMGIDGCGQSNGPVGLFLDGHARSEEHTSELQSLMRISYAVFCLKKKKKKK